MSRTQLVGMLVVAVVVLGLLTVAVVWLGRPLPSREPGVMATVTAAVERQATDEAAAIAVLHDATRAGPRFGEGIGGTGTSTPPYDAVHAAAIAALGRIKSTAAVAALSEVATRDDRRLSLYAVEALRQQNTRAAVPAFLTVLRQEDRRLHRLDDNFTRLTNETIRALLDVADSNTLRALRELRQSGLRAIDADVARAIRAAEQRVQEQAEIKEPEVPGGRGAAPGR